jgi:prepilin-type N-terminal cleavage/methylation domain-containing protein
MKKGFTLIELIIVITVIAIISYPITVFILNSVSETQNEIRKVELNQETREVLDSIVDVIRQADADKIYLFDDLGNDITADDSGIASKIEITYKNAYTDSDIAVGFMLENKSIIRYNPDDLTQNYAVISSEIGYKEVSDFEIKFSKSDPEVTNQSFTKYELNMKVHEGNGSTLIGKKIDVNVQTSLIKYCEPD